MHTISPHHFNIIQTSAKNPKIFLFCLSAQLKLYISQQEQEEAIILAGSAYVLYLVSLRGSAGSHCSLPVLALACLSANPMHFRTLSNKQSLYAPPDWNRENTDKIFRKVIMQTNFWTKVVFFLAVWTYWDKVIFAIHKQIVLHCSGCVQVFKSTHCT